ncbi:hypothetical protein FRC10_003307 [Ceratobasidium sp. 414]|nr:hypothetical protein FRC10_003307 [Ceratobasidium sp. 414]
MFFARLAIAALSFGSVAMVLAAPLRISSNLVARSLAKFPIQRRDVLAFHEAVIHATTTLEELEPQIFTLTLDPSGAVTPQLAAAMNEVAPAMNTVTEKLSAAGVNQDSLLATADGGMLAPEALAAELNSMLIAVSGILTYIQGLKSTASIQPSVAHLRDQVTILQTKIGEIIPEISGSLESVTTSILRPIAIVIEL